MSQAHQDADGSGYGTTDKHARGGPTSELDVKDKIVSPDVYDEIAGRMGTGNYDDEEYWRQTEAHKQSLFGEALFNRVLRDQVEYEAKYELGVRGWQFFDEERSKDMKEFDGWEDWNESEQERKARKVGRDETIRRRGEHIWILLPEEERVKVLEQYATASPAFLTPHTRMVEFRHEASKSRGARLMDNYFGRVRKLIGDKGVEKAKKSIFSRGGGGR